MFVNIDGKKVMIEMRDDENVAQVALSMCRKWKLSARDCNRIVAELSKLQQKIETKVASLSPENKDLHEYEQEALVYNHHSGIDYSQKIEPKLQVLWDEKMLTLQRYAGESVHGAVDRFCYAFALDNFMCTNVRQRFTCLVDHYPDDIRACTPEQARNPDTSSSRHEEEDVAFLSIRRRWRSILYSCFSLLLALLFVVLQHPPNIE